MLFIFKNIHRYQKTGVFRLLFVGVYRKVLQRSLKENLPGSWRLHWADELSVERRQKEEELQLAKNW